MGLSRSLPLVFLVLTRAMFAAAYNSFEFLLVMYLSSVHSMLAAQWCTALVWAISLGVHYLWDTKSAVGRAWTPYSFLQLTGFVVFAFGQNVYSELVPVLLEDFAPVVEDGQIESVVSGNY